MKTYFAIVHKDRDSAVGVVFPDLPGCFSAGDTFDKAIANAHVALKLYAEAELDAGRQLPKPRTFEALYGYRENSRGIERCALCRHSPRGGNARAGQN